MDCYGFGFRSELKNDALDHKGNASYDGASIIMIIIAIVTLVLKRVSWRLVCTTLVLKHRSIYKQQVGQYYQHRNANGYLPPGFFENPKFVSDSFLENLVNLFFT